MANYDSNYNPSADPRLDDAPFTGEEVADHTADVADTDASLERASREDRDAAKTDSHQRLSVEVDSLLSDVREDERNVSEGTRGKKVDAYKPGT